MQEIKVAVRMDAEHLQESKFSIELAFWDEQWFLKTDITQLKQSIDYHKLEVASIHAPAFRMLRGDTVWPWCKLFEIARMLGVTHIVAHPPFGKFREFADSLPELCSFMSYFGELRICWEKFSSKRRVLSTFEEFSEIMNLSPKFGYCWDYSHVDGDEGEIEPYLPFTPIIHVSNTNTEGNLRHQRLFISGQRLNYNIVLKVLKDNNWTGLLVLEYMKDLHEYLVSDAHDLDWKIRSMMG